MTSRTSRVECLAIQEAVSSGSTQFKTSVTVRIGSVMSREDQSPVESVNAKEAA